MILFFTLLTGIIGATSTYLLAHKTNWGPVRASALLSLLVGIIFMGISKHSPSELLTNIPLIFIGASFVGMTSPERMNLMGIALSGALFGGIYLLIPISYSGYGGAMGTAACMSVLSVYGLIHLRNLFSTKKG